MSTRPHVGKPFLFRPGRGAMPPYLAGRETEQRLLKKRLACLQRKESPPAGTVLIGPRGNGKTVLMRWFEQEINAAEKKPDVVWLTPDEFPDGGCGLSGAGRLQLCVMSSRKPVNPFTPGAGLMPPVLAGREAEKSMLTERLNRLCHPDGPYAPRHVLISGPRGVGKTVLLRWVEMEFSRTFADGSVIRTKADNVRTLTQLARVLDQQVIENEVRHAWAANLGPVGGGRTPQAPEVDAPWGHLLEQSLLNRYAPSRAADAGNVRPLLITVDEAHTLNAEVAVTIANLAQEMASATAQVWLVLAGTPGLLNHLSTVGPVDPATGKRASATFVERNDKLYPGALARDVARQALAAPLHERGCQAHGDALDEALDDAQGYPWFIQLWGEALWENRRGAGRIDKQALAAAREKVDDERTRIYQARYDELNEPLPTGLNGRQVLTAAAALADHYLAHDNAPLPQPELTAVLDSLHEARISADDHKALKKRFLDTGFVVEKPVGRKMYCCVGIPSLANFIAAAMPPGQPGSAWARRPSTSPAT